MTQSEETCETTTLEADSMVSAAKKQKTEKAIPTEGEERTLKEVELTKLKELLGKVMVDVKKYEDLVDVATRTELK